MNDIGMVFFFALAAQEVFEATLPGGSLASVRRAMSPLGAAVGGMLAPALIYLALVVVGISASIGFSVALFFATAAFPEGEALTQTKMGALLSFAAAPMAIVTARMCGIRRSNHAT